MSTKKVHICKCYTCNMTYINGCKQTTKKWSHLHFHNGLLFLSSYLSNNPLIRPPLLWIPQNSIRSRQRAVCKRTHYEIGQTQWSYFLNPIQNTWSHNNKYKSRLTCICKSLKKKKTLKHMRPSSSTNFLFKSHQRASK